MPYHVRKAGSKYEIVRKEDGKVVGTSNSRQKAQASVRARMSGERRTKKKAR